MAEFKYTKEEIDEIKKILDEIKGKLLMSNEDYYFSRLIDYSFDEIVTKHWFSKKKEKYYIISLIVIDYGNDKFKTYNNTNGIICTHIGVKKLLEMKESADTLFKKLKHFNYTISTIEK